MGYLTNFLKVKKKTVLLQFIFSLSVLCLFSIRLADDVFTFLLLGSLGILLFHLFYLRKGSLVQSYILDITIWLYIFTLYIISFFIFADLFPLYSGVTIPRTQYYYLGLSLIFRIVFRVVVILFICNFYSIFAIRRLYKLNIFTKDIFLFLFISLLSGFSSFVVYAFYFGMFDFLSNPPKFLVDMASVNSVKAISPEKNTSFWMSWLPSVPSSWIHYAMGDEPKVVMEETSYNKAGDPINHTKVKVVCKTQPGEPAHPPVYKKEIKSFVFQELLCDTIRADGEALSDGANKATQLYYLMRTFFACRKSVNDALQLEIEKSKPEM